MIDVSKAVIFATFTALSNVRFSAVKKLPNSKDEMIALMLEG